MLEYVSCYDPPVVKGDLNKERRATFESTDQEMFLHVGHFVSWYAATEFAITLLLHRFTAGTHPTAFHQLTLGMDAKTKTERLLRLLEATGWTLEDGLKKRLNHFTKRLVEIRNHLVHSHLYWPEGDKLEMTSIGAPPTYASELWGAPEPKKIEGLELFERSVWLGLFAKDLLAALNEIPDPVQRGGVLEIGRYQSSLPTGDRSSPEKQARRAKADKPARKQPPKA